MSYEAVPCMFRSSQGTAGDAGYAKIGLLIRPVAGTSGAQTNQQQNIQQLAPNMTGGPAPLRVQGQFRSGAPIQVMGENAPRLLLPAQVKVRVGGQPDAVIGNACNIGWQQSAGGPIRGGTTFTSPTPSITSPTPSQMRSASACSASPHTDLTPLSPAPTLFNQHQFRTEPASRVSLARRSTPWHSNSAPASDTSTSPDSGIQSAAATRPNSLTPAEACTSVCEAEETAEEDLDFTDMPRLYPADLEHSDQPGTSGVKEKECSTKEDNLSAHGSECETAAAPTVTINASTMDSKEIVEHLLQMDPEKAKIIANMIKKKTVQQKRRSGERQNSPVSTLKKSRPGSAASDELRKSEEEVKIEMIHTHSVSPSLCHDTVVVPMESAVSSPPPPVLARVQVTVPVQSESDVRVAYRLAVQKMLEQKLARLIESMTGEMNELQVQRTHPGRKTTGRVKSPWEIEGKKRKRRSEEKIEGIFADENRSFPQDFKPREKISQYKASELKFHLKDVPLCKESRTYPTLGSLEVNVPEATPRKNSISTPSPRKLEKDKRRRDTVGAVDRELFRQRLPTRTLSKRRNSEVPLDDVVMEKKKDMDYIHINKSFCLDSDLSSDWSVPRVLCGCARGACTSDAECINRALCVQCPTNCHMQLCVNKKFWKEDAVRQLSCTVNKGRKTLKTKMARRAGDFLGEFCGEVISYSTAVSRYSQHTGDTGPPMLALSSKLFVDATENGNITRYIRHSCRPNCRIEVWSIGEHLRAGIFPINDIPSGSELTVNMGGLLPVERKCHCGVEKCRLLIGAAKNAQISASSMEIPLEETATVMNSRVFLLRNRRASIRKAATQHFARSSSLPLTDVACMRRVFEGLQRRIRHVDGSLPIRAHQGYCKISHLLKVLARNDNPASSLANLQSFKFAVERWLYQLDDDDYDRVYSALCQHYLSNLPSTSADSADKKKENGKIAKQEMDLSYLDSHVRVNSYNPDDAWSNNNCEEGDDAVRCECGLLEEDGGEMTQCDRCNFWLHNDCVGNVVANMDYVCRFCTGDIKGGTPSTDVLLHKKLEPRFEECLYFKALLNGRNMQVRLNETVYVQRAIGEEHKKILKRFESTEKKKKDKNEGPGNMVVKPPTMLEHEEFDRKDLRIFRVDRLFYAPGGHRFVFGFYYARPHETVCDSNREFHKNEVFVTPFYDTLPLDAVVGRCTVLDPDTWSKGRPTVPLFKEEDVFVCEYRINGKQRSFEKVPTGSRFYINTQPYVFHQFPTLQKLQRQFTPFVSNDKSSPRHSKNMKVEEMQREEAIKRMASQSLDSLVTRLQTASTGSSISGKAVTSSTPSSRKSSGSEGRRKRSIS